VKDWKPNNLKVFWTNKTKPILEDLVYIEYIKKVIKSRKSKDRQLSKTNNNKKINNGSQIKTEPKD
jgi:predicted house-cleaning noncanonical NTP pyrophosphatase (MazG superfamily)